ncbi:hypothetical protein B0A55_02001 [Friedmanniomyces simplex]|uniref:RING-CH-type domain-containing protein n=1 Tax=Friedmanniomyces simplex TaxID=329884 RepID=A0A4U0XS81_9PEZI|nr:hypothetical protein B0A55_02001 [Friedmanniomyces simplex]
MASLPPRQQSQRRVSPQQQDSHAQQTPQSPVRARSATSEDSQTLFINHPPTADDTKHTQDQPSLPTQTPLPGSREDPAVKTCWICFADSTEDTASTSPWRDPCPCALVAHEECLLDWIADLELPKNNRHHAIRQPKIECPQCKSEIKLARPRNYVVDAVRALERVGARTVTPGALTFLSASLYQSSLAWGMHSVYAVFGSEDGYRILRPLLRNAIRPPIEVYLDTPREAAQKMLGLILDHLVHWRLYVGLPLISPMLILSRTKLADSLLPVLPVLFFATSQHAVREPLDFTHWPPSAGLCFAVLPYVRAAYNAYYDRVWAAKVRRWTKEIQPRNGQDQNDADDDLQNPVAEEQIRADVDGENIFEVRIDGGIWDEWEELPAEAEQAPQHQPRRRQNQPAAAQAPPLAQPPVPDNDEEEEQADPPPDIADNRPQPIDPQVDQLMNDPPVQRPADPQPQQPEQPAPAPAAPAAPAAAAAGERRLSFSPTTLASTILGALLFPTLAGLSGDLLKLVLPAVYTTPAQLLRTTSFFGRKSAGVQSVKGGGFLSERWARSLVGGCLFVVIKDAVGLYVRWKMVEMHRRRRVLDYPAGQGGGRGERGRGRGRT